MPSEQRLHPSSIFFAFGQSLKRYAVPGLLVLFTARSSGGPDGSFGYLPRNWELWMMLLLIPSALAAVVRFLSFRIRYEGTELVIRSGILFRNERHVPYARIQNLDAVQNLLHRAFGVVEVRVETGGGTEVEARISVLPVAAFEEMRRRVVEGRTQGAVLHSADLWPIAQPPPAPEGRSLLQLPIAELLLFGFLENRGIVIIGAAYGLLWELGLLEGLWGRFFSDRASGKGMVRGIARVVFAGDPAPLGRIAFAIAAILALLIFVRLLSMVWGAIRLYGFHLLRVGEDLRTEYGLFTRVVTTIPLRRVQTLTIKEAPLQRLVGRVSVRVETAGGRGPEHGERAAEREWLAPILRPEDLPGLVRQVLPELELDAVTWQPPHPRAFRRAVKPALFVALLLTLPLVGALRPWGSLAFLVTVPWAVFSARQYVRHLGWAADDDVVLFRSGWLWRNLTVARVVKIQAVTLTESPFDRRLDMASVSVDTAGAGERSHRVAIPYLGNDIARNLHRKLATRAATTTFRW